MFTLGTAAKHVGKSKPTISKAIKDGKLSAKKLNGVYQIDPSELDRVFPVSRSTEVQSSPQKGDDDAVSVALTKQRNFYLEEEIERLKQENEGMKAERDNALQNAQEKYNRLVALLEDQRTKREEQSPKHEEQIYKLVEQISKREDQISKLVEQISKPIWARIFKFK